MPNCCPAINTALTDPNARNTVFVPYDNAWDTLAASWNLTFNAMLVQETDRLRRVRGAVQQSCGSSAAGCSCPQPSLARAA